MLLVLLRRAAAAAAADAAEYDGDDAAAAPTNITTLHLSDGMFCFLYKRHMKLDDDIALHTLNYSLIIERRTCLAFLHRPFHHATAAADRLRYSPRDERRPAHLWPPVQQQERSGTKVPFLQLYNRIADAEPRDLDTCVGISEPTVGLLSVHAPHNTGNIILGYQINGSAIIFSVVSVDNWRVDPSQRHIVFGKFWDTVPELRTVPVVSGKLHGPRPVDGSKSDALAAGFVTLSTRAFFNTIFSAKIGDRTAFVLAADSRISSVLATLGQSYGFGSDNHNSNAYLSWYWPPSTFSEYNRQEYVIKAKALGVDVMFVSAVLTKELTEDRKRYPSGFHATADFLRSAGLEVGLHILPIIVWPTTQLAQRHPEVLVPEGLAPTFRSGRKAGPWTEDIAFWWCHDKVGPAAKAGNTASPYGWGREWCAGLNMVLKGDYYWSHAGRYRSGGAVGFAGGNGSHGVVTNLTKLHEPLPQMTLSLVMHPLANMTGSRTQQIVMSKAGQFELSIVSAPGYDYRGNLRWSVRTVDGVWRNATTETAPIALHNRSDYVVKCTFNNGTSKVFVNGHTSTSSTSSISISMAGADSPLYFGSSDTTAQTSQRVGFVGALEEISLKNVSAEGRQAYLFAEPSIRPTGSYLVDLSREEGRLFFSETVSSVLNSASACTVHIDGFEKLAMIGAEDWPHSNATFASPWERTNFSSKFPPQVHREGWPGLWGLGILKGLEKTHNSLVQPTAMEVSLMVPGAGPWRPEIAPYIDEPRVDLMTLGMTWHGGMLLRMRRSGTAINAYCTRLSFLLNRTINDYWHGGLIAGGIPPQPCEIYADGVAFWAQPELAAGVKRWITRFRFFGHATPGNINSIGSDAYATSLVGGTIGHRIIPVSIYIGPTAPPAVVLPTSSDVENATMLLFIAHGRHSPRLLISHGRTEFRNMSLTLLGNIDDINVTLTGPFWHLHRQTVEASILDASATVIKSWQIFPKKQTGARPFHLPNTLQIGDTILLRKSVPLWPKHAILA
jgi:hypothetical protein